MRTVVPQGANSSEEGATPTVSSSGDNNVGIKKVAFYLLPLLVFLLVWIILSHYNVLFFWKLLAATLISSFSPNLFKNILGVGKQGDGKGKAVVSANIPVGIIWGLFFLILVSHYAVPKENLSAEKPREKNGIVRQAGVLENVDDVWIIDNIFYDGDALDIEVTGGAVEMISGRVFTPGKHQETITGNGSIGFKALTNTPTKVRVWFRE
ncbi:MAG: hypothetical protein JST_000209 [Candidatus Parcubacteria bacterium]